MVTIAKAKPSSMFLALYEWAMGASLFVTTIRDRLEQGDSGCEMLIYDVVNRCQKPFVLEQVLQIINLLERIVWHN